MAWVVVHVLLLLLFSISLSAGLVPLFDVDETMKADASGPDVVDAALDAIDTTCQFPRDKLFMGRYAQAVTQYGIYNTTGGIWPVSEEMLTATQRLASSTHYRATILDIFNIDWESVTMTDLSKPFISALAFKLYLQTLPNCSIPHGIIHQGAFITDKLPSGSPSIQTKFIENVQDQTDCLSSLADVVVILDGSSVVGADNFATMTSFFANLTHLASMGTSRTKMAVVQYSNQVRVEFLLNQYNDTSRMAAAVEGIQYFGGSGNDTGNITAALWRSAGLFSTANGARHNDTGVARIVIVLTQSISGDVNGTMAALTRLKEIGGATYAVGIGGGVTTEYLNMIASGCNEVTHLRNYSELASYLPELRLLMCKQPAAPNLGHPIFLNFAASQRAYASYPINITKGLYVELSTSADRITAYISTKVRNPNMASYHWRCRGFMNRPGLCFIPPEQLRNVTRANQTTVTVYSMFSIDVGLGIEQAMENEELINSVINFKSGNSRLHSSFSLVIAALLLLFKLSMIQM